MYERGSCKNEEIQCNFRNNFCHNEHYQVLCGAVAGNNNVKFCRLRIVLLKVGTSNSTSDSCKAKELVESATRCQNICGYVKLLLNPVVL